ncbi:MAG: 1,3-beta-galactosyl-N-acetylhexosamine phosphorylase [Actinomycetaceae bacterium]|nr:1,3-beta-galactosyl-N-acetylhexosamine phosphorylase [Actinomycetaceae bacterium]
MTSTGRVTLPIEIGIDDQVKDLMKRLGADAVRNSDGTELPALVHELGAQVYSTYFPARGDQEWALAHPDTTPHLFLQSRRTPAHSGPLTINVMEGYLREQIAPDADVDLDLYWQVIDRTTGETLPRDAWELLGDEEVRIAQPIPGHVYTVNFLARQIWDCTQMYNYITNNWDDDPTRVQERPYDVRIPEVWDRVRSELNRWLKAHPEVDVVRFTTFFYHFTLVFNEHRKEQFVDWFGYSMTVSVPALEAFAEEYGYRLTPEDFVDEGYYNCSFRVPSKQFRDWMEFINVFVSSRVRELTDAVHAAGKEAMMFLGDNWIGTEPYGKRFKETGIDAVVGSVGNAATCRMIADIDVSYTEGRFLPYFFPDVFNEGGDPVGEANRSWLCARRAIVRSPLDRIGYGGYLSLALKFPEFIDRIEQICQEFRDIYEAADGKSPQTANVRVGILNAWGAVRSWQTHMVAHALPYEQTDAYVGVIEALAGLPFEVDFLSFDDIREGVPENIEVLINVGEAGTAFSGGRYWVDPQIQATVRAFVARGGGLIGVGEPCAYSANGAFNQLSDVFGVDREQSWSLSTDRYPVVLDTHFITDGEGGEPLSPVTTGGARYWVPVTDSVRILAMDGVSVTGAVHEFGCGRSVYLAGLPYSQSNARLLAKSIFWAARAEDEYFQTGHCVDPRVDVAFYDSGSVVVYNSSMDEVVTDLVCAGESVQSLALKPLELRWLS